MTEGSAIWARFFPGEPHHIDAYHRAVRDRAGPDSVILDVGCGANADFDDLRRAGRVVWGVDFQPHPQLVAPDQQPSDSQQRADHLRERRASPRQPALRRVYRADDVEQVPLASRIDDTSSSRSFRS